MSKPCRTTAEWAEIAELDADARQLAGPASDARSLAETLARGHAVDAIRLLAHLLPKREAVLWAWSCAKRAATADCPPVSASLAATEKWIAQPPDESRRAAMAAAQDAQVGSPAGAAGLAAFLSGDTLAPAGAHTVPPPEFLAAKAVAASVMLAAVANEPQNAETRYHESLVRGFELAQRIHLWERLSAPPQKEA